MALPKITSAFLSVTHDCCLRCRYCFIHQNPDYITYDTAKYAVDWLYQNYLDDGERNPPGVTYFGGEPMLCYESILVPLTTYIRETYGDIFSISLTTNGVLLNEERLKFLEGNKVGMLLSMDGGKQTQDEQRPFPGGGSSFDALENKLETILRYYPDVGFRSTITAESAGVWFDNFCFARDAGFRSWFGMPNHFEVWDEEAVRKLADGARRFGDYFIECCRSGERPVPFSSFDRMFRTIRNINSNIRAGVNRPVEDCAVCGRCGLGGTHYAAIDPGGRVFTCQDMSSFENEDSPFYIGTIFDGVDEDRRMAMVLDYNTRRCHGKDCSQCRLDRVCDGGCVANNYMANGDIRSIPTIHCEWYQILLEEAIRVMGVLGQEDNEIFRGIWNDG